MPKFNAAQFPEVYNYLDIKMSDLGVVMLDVDPIQVTDMVDQGKQDLYFSENPGLTYVQGAVAESGAHLTLLFGLMKKGLEYKPVIDAVLEGWVPPRLEIESVEAFESMYPGTEPYSCIVAKVKVTDELLEGHARLQMLPHVDTFPDYKPHITLAYVNKDAEAKWLKALQGLGSKRFAVNGINYGGGNR